MKINKSKIITVFGIMALAFAFFTMAPVANAGYYGPEDDCEYYGDCGVYFDDCEYYGDCGDTYYDYDDCDYYGDCGDVYYDDCNTCSTDSVNGDYYDYIHSTNYNENYTEVNNEVVIEYVDEEFPAVTGTCSVDVSHAETGDVVEWSAMGDGGDGYYSYTWSGTDGLHSVYPVITKIYNTSGTKTANVVISSNGESVTRTCSVVIDGNNHYEEDDLDGSCSGSPSRVDEDERVTWTARPTGGNGHYTYDWSGTDGLDGNNKSITEYYNDSGTKYATVRITSDGQTITRKCSVRVDNDNNDNEDNDDLDAYCKASPNNGDINDTIKWTVYPDGGDGDYDYDWDGDNNLSGTKKSVSKKYTTSGRKEAEVRVKSDGDSITVRCYADIDKDNVVIHHNDDGGIYLSSIPATGISPTMKIVLFSTGMLMWSAFLAYLYIARRNEKMKEREVLASIGE